MARQVIAQAVTDLSHDLGNSLPTPGFCLPICKMKQEG